MYCFRDVVLSPFGQSRNTTFSIPPRQSHKLSSSPFPPWKDTIVFLSLFSGTQLWQAVWVVCYATRKTIPHQPFEGHCVGNINHTITIFLYLLIFQLFLFNKTLSPPRLLISLGKVPCRRGSWVAVHDEILNSARLGGLDLISDCNDKGIQVVWTRNYGHFYVAHALCGGVEIDAINRLLPEITMRDHTPWRVDNEIHPLICWRYCFKSTLINAEIRISKHKSCFNSEASLNNCTIANGLEDTHVCTLKTYSVFKR